MCPSVHLVEKGSTPELAIWTLAGDPHAAIPIFAGEAMAVQCGEGCHLSVALSPCEFLLGGSVGMMAAAAWR